MSNNLGTLVIAPIRPYSSGDTFATAFANEVQGGHHQVQTITDRDNITVDRRSEGMLCTVLQPTPVTFQLIGGILNSNWIIFNAGSGSGSTILTVKDQNTGFEQVGVDVLNFIGNNPLTNVQVLPGGGRQVDIWIQAPSYAYHFMQDSTTSVSNHNASGSRYIANNIGSVNSQTYRGNWLAGSSQLYEDAHNNTFQTWSYSTTGSFAIYKSDPGSYIEVVYFYYTGNTVNDKVISTLTLPIVFSSTGVTLTTGNTVCNITLGPILNDSNRFKARISSITLNTNLLTGGNGGRVGLVSITHRNVTNIGFDDYIYNSQPDIFIDHVTSNVNIGSVDIYQSGTTNYIFVSGVRHYVAGTQFKLDVNAMENINDHSWTTNTLSVATSNFNFITPSYNTYQTQAGWSNWNDSFDKTGINFTEQGGRLTISTSPVFIKNTASASGTARNLNSTQTKTDSMGVLIDTRVDSSTKLMEMFIREDYTNHGKLATTARLYDDGTPSGVTEKVWDPYENLVTGNTNFTNGLQITGGYLTYPQENFNSYEPAFVDYSSASGWRTYVRKFTATNLSKISKTGILSFSFVSGYEITEFDINGSNPQVKIELNWHNGSSWSRLGAVNSGDLYVTGEPGNNQNCRINSNTYGFVQKGGWSGFTTGSNNQLRFTLGDLPTSGSNFIYVRISINDTRKNIRVTQLSLSGEDWATS